MAIVNKINLAPTSAENTTYESSGSVSTRDFKIVRQKTIENTTLGSELKLSVDGLTVDVGKYNNGILVGAHYNFNGTGMTITNGDLTIKNNAGTNVFYADVNGNLYITGNIDASSITTGTLSTSRIPNLSADKITTGIMSADRIYGGTINGNNVSVTNLSASNIVAGSLSVDRLSVGTVSGWYFGSSDISRSGISLGSGNITLTGTGTNGPTINFNYGGGSTRFYNYAQYWIAAQNNFRVDSQFMSIGTASFLSDINCDGDVGGATGTFGYTITSYVRPSINDLYDVGTSTYRYDDVYATNGTIQTSDLTEKTDVVPIEHGIDLILNVQPVQFKYINGSSGRVHYGVVAQWLKDTMTNVGIEDAAVYIDPEEGTKGVRYTELIGPMIQTIQHLNERIKVLENGN